MLYAWSLLLYLWAGLALESHLYPRIQHNHMEARLIVMFWPIILGYTMWMLIKWILGK